MVVGFVEFGELGAWDRGAPLEGAFAEAVGDGGRVGGDGQEDAEVFFGEARGCEDGARDGGIGGCGAPRAREGVGGDVAEGEDGGASALGEDVEIGEDASRACAAREGEVLDLVDDDESGVGFGRLISDAVGDFVEGRLARGRSVGGSGNGGRGRMPEFGGGRGAGWGRRSLRR